VSLSPSAGFTLSDGLVVPSPILMIDGNCFMWDVGHPTDGTKPDGKPKSEFGLDWDGWSKDKLAVFETLSPRPGENPPFSNLRRQIATRPSNALTLVLARPRRDYPVWYRRKGALCTSGGPDLFERTRHPSRRSRFGAFSDAGSLGSGRGGERILSAVTD
jgi:hypothetical protein